MKKTILVATAIFALTTFSAPVKSVVGAKNISSIQDAGFPENPTASDYIQDGLIALWDGIENSGYGMHSDSTDIWVDLKGSYSVPISNFVVGEDYVRSQSSQVSTTTSLIINGFSDSGHMEVCISGLKNTGSWYSPFIRAAGYWTFDQANPSKPETLSIKFACDMGGQYMMRPYDLYTPSYWYPFLGEINSLSLPLVYKDRRRAHTVYVDSEKFTDFSSGGTLQNATPSGLVTIGIAKGTCNYHCIRLYNRVLSDKEIHYNYLIDKLRFNLP
jgi:hypothetical protein